MQQACLYGCKLILMKISTYLIVSLIALFCLSSCNTFIGLTRDIQTLGGGLENKAHGKTWQGNAPANAPASVAPQQ